MRRTQLPYSRGDSSSEASRTYRRRLGVIISKDMFKQTFASVPVATTMAVDSVILQNLCDKSSGRWYIVTDVANAEVLVMDNCERTVKFLIAMAKGLPIVSTKWLEAFNATEVKPKYEEYLFRNSDFEKQHQFNIAKSISTAQKHKIFAGYEFLTTPNIMPKPADIKEIIKCAGGTVHEETPVAQEKQNIYLISSLQDENLWRSYQRTNSNIRITTTEGVMSAVLRQEITPLGTM